MGIFMEGKLLIEDQFDLFHSSDYSAMNRMMSIVIYF